MSHLRLRQCKSRRVEEAEGSTVEDHKSSPDTYQGEQHSVLTVRSQMGRVYVHERPSRRTISTSGCGVMALTNAVYAMNGEFISPTKIAKFSVSRGHYFYNQGTADTLYKDFAKKYGATYHFKHKGKYIH